MKRWKNIISHILVWLLFTIIGLAIIFLIALLIYLPIVLLTPLISLIGISI